MRVALLSSYNLDLLPRATSKRLAVHGVSIEWYVAPFGQYRQEILAATSGSKEFHPDIVLLAVDADECLDATDAWLILLETAATAYGGAIVLVHNCALRQAVPNRLMEWNQSGSRRLRGAILNTQLAAVAQRFRNLRVLDLEDLIFRVGADRMFDARMYYLAKMHFSAIGLERVAAQLATAILAVRGRRHKCLVLDLDNTLWGGVLGEVGIEHIALGPDGEGKAFQDFQRQVLRLQQSGVLLALCSKNDEAVAWNAIGAHPHMLLRPSHFAAWRIDWADKAGNLQAIAEELNLGLDSLVFLDDSPHERSLVRTLLPDVTVPEMPVDAADFPAFAADLPYFETFWVGAEDVDRTRMYDEERQRKTAQRSAPSLRSFLESLGIRIKVEEATPFTIPRIAQLTQKTNQFNLSVKRYSEQEIQERAHDPAWKVLNVSAADRFGDAGTVGAALMEFGEGSVRLDTFLMSCRVLGRGIEDAFLASVASYAASAKAAELFAPYVATSRNGMVRDFLSRHGFLQADATFVRSLREPLERPEWVVIEQ